jgi:ureidoacrylate peracid hydrolase
MRREITVDARPAPLELDLDRTAVIVVDMQNTFAEKGGLFDVAGISDIPRIKKVIPPCKEVIDSARRKNCTIIYLQQHFDLAIPDKEKEQSPVWQKSRALKYLSAHPELKEVSPVEHTWGFQIIDELKPTDSSICVIKQRYSGFKDTILDDVLKKNNIKYIVFTGIMTNICVESTLRDAFFFDYFPILISDAIAHSGPDYIRDAVLHNVETIFGWVTDSKKFCKSLS